VLQHKTVSSDALRAPRRTLATVCWLCPEGSWHLCLYNEQSRAFLQGENNQSLTRRPPRPLTRIKNHLHVGFFFFPPMWDFFFSPLRKEPPPLVTLKSCRFLSEVEFHLSRLILPLVLFLRWLRSNLNP